MHKSPVGKTESVSESVCVASATVIGHRYGVKVTFQIHMLTWQRWGSSTV